MLPSIDIFGVVILEPTTALTDYLLAILACRFGFRVLHGNDRYPARLWACAFLCIGLAALLGGTSHGFVRYLGETGNFLAWKGTVYAIGLSMLCAVSGTIAACPLGTGTARLLQAANLIGFAVYAYWMLDHDRFVYVIYHYVPSMLTIASLYGWLLVSRGSKAARWILAGIAVTLSGAVVQQSGFTLHRYFNNNDLYHVIQLGGLYLLYRGITLPES